MKYDGPMNHLDDWEESVAARYPASTGTFRDYSQNVRPAIREFYRLNHRHQTIRCSLCRK